MNRFDQQIIDDTRANGSALITESMCNELVLFQREEIDPTKYLYRLKTNIQVECGVSRNIDTGLTNALFEFLQEFNVKPNLIMMSRDTYHEYYYQMIEICTTNTSIFTPEFNFRGIKIETCEALEINDVVFDFTK